MSYRCLFVCVVLPRMEFEQRPDASSNEAVADGGPHEKREEKRRRERDASSESKSRRRRGRDKGRRRSRSREKSRGRRSSSRKRSRTPPRRRKRTLFDVRPQPAGEVEQTLSGALVPAPMSSVIPQDVLIQPDLSDPNGNPPILYPGMGLPGEGCMR